MTGGVKIRFSALREAEWHEYLIRFVLGGLATVLAGLIAKRDGPETGGLFLAFPAIFCASATLIEAHEQRRKARAGFKGARRGREAAALDAAGTALGGIGLASFAAAVWLLARPLGWAALLPALGTWSIVSLALWWTRRHLRRTR
jgi:hypothetical protein